MDVPVPPGTGTARVPEQALLDHEDLMTDPEMDRELLGGRYRPASQPGGAASGC
jgi:hypothetical protein